MFANKVVLITGGSAGIGAGTAICFAKEGASLAIVGRNEAKLKDVAERCEKLGATVLTIKADISKDDEARDMIEQTIDKYKKLDVLVNNAGILRNTTIPESNLLEMFDEVMNTNLRALVLITNLSVPYLRETKGNIVNVSSIASTNFLAGLSVYGMSKASIDYFTKCSAIELAPFGVRVNSVNPGPVATDMMQSLNDYMTKTYDLGKFKLTGRTSEPEEIGDMIVYLASDKARSVTGSHYIIDNGSLLGISLE